METSNRRKSMVKGARGTSDQSDSKEVNSSPLVALKNIASYWFRLVWKGERSSYREMDHSVQESIPRWSHAMAT